MELRLLPPAGAVRRAAALAAVASAVAGCSGGGDGRDEALAYIEAANRIQEQLAPAQREAQAAVGAFSRGRSGPRLAERLAAAAATMRETRASLSLLRPPPEAGSLHANLLKLLDLQAGVTAELALAAGYLPSATAVIGSADRARAALARALARAESRAEQAAALEAYARRVDEELERLRGLGSPPVLGPWHSSQESRLASSGGLAAALAAAVRSGDAGAVQRTHRAFARRAADAGAVRREQAKAVAAFNARLEEQQQLLETIYREQAALAEQLGS